MLFKRNKKEIQYLAPGIPITEFGTGIEKVHIGTCLLCIKEIKVPATVSYQNADHSAYSYGGIKVDSFSICNECRKRIVKLLYGEKKR